MKENLFRTLNKAIPKRDIILFYSQYDYYDNPYYLYKKMRDLGICDEFECVWLVESKEGYERATQDGALAVLLKNKFQALKYILSAKYFVTSTTGGAWWKAKNQIGIFLDHGIPSIKTVGSYLDPKITREQWKYFDYAISTSHFTRVLQSSIYQINPNKVIITGLPRNDIVFESSMKEATGILEAALNTEIEEYEYRIFYLPTFRLFEPEYMKRQFLKMMKNPEFVRFLKKYDALIVMKPHRKEENVFRELLKTHNIDRIKILSNYYLRKRNLTIYELFKSIDIMVSDYSSVWIEYLLLNRPIVYHIPDIKRYRKKRGFVIEPYELWTPGDKSYKISDLITYLEEAINSPEKWRREREFLQKMMFKYYDAKARERIINYFWKK